MRRVHSALSALISRGWRGAGRSEAEILRGAGLDRSIEEVMVSRKANRVMGGGSSSSAAYDPYVMHVMYY